MIEPRFPVDVTFGRDVPQKHLKAKFSFRNYDFISERKKRDLSLQIDDLISQMKSRETTFFVLEEFCQVLDGYDRREVITLLKEKISRGPEHPLRWEDIT